VNGSVSTLVHGTIGRVSHVRIYGTRLSFVVMSSSEYMKMVEDAVSFAVPDPKAPGVAGIAPSLAYHPSPPPPRAFGSGTAKRPLDARTV